MLNIKDIDLSAIPIQVLQDVDKRISDWKSSGGNDEDHYIQNQIKYLQRVEANIKEKK